MSFNTSFKATAGPLLIFRGENSQLLCSASSLAEERLYQQQRQRRVTACVFQLERFHFDGLARDARKHVII